MIHEIPPGSMLEIPPPDERLIEIAREVQSQNREILRQNALILGMHPTAFIVTPGTSNE